MKQSYDYTKQSLLHWIKANILCPIKGFEHKKNPDGSNFTLEQQIRATQHQVIAVADYFLNTGKSRNEVLTIISAFKK